MSDYSTTHVKRSRPTRSDLLREPREELVERCLKLIEQLAGKQQSDDLVQLKELNEKLRAESSQREGILVMRLTAKEQEVQDLLTQLQDTKQSLCPGSSQLQSMLLDPAVNLLFESFKKELNESKAQLKQAQDDLSAYKFTPDSHIGKRLMAKCRLLLNENEELGRTISSGSVAKLESTIAMEKKLSQEMRKAEKDAEYVLHELSDDMEAMQSTIYQLQQTLKETSEQLQLAQDENRRLRAATTVPPGTSAATPTESPGGAPEGATPPQQVKQRTDSSNAEDLNIRLKRTAPSSPVATNARLKSRHTDKSSDASAERTNYKSGGGARNRGTGSHGNQDRVKGGSSTRAGHHVRQGADPPSEPRTPAGAAVATRQDEPSNGSSRHGNAEPIAMDTTDAGSTENSRPAIERENQRPRTGNNSSSMSKTDSPSSELLANGLIGKHSSTLTEACQKV